MLEQGAPGEKGTELEVVGIVADTHYQNLKQAPEEQWLVALASGRVLESMLYGVGAHDPLTFVTVPMVLAAVAIVATWLPARRAARVDPAVALRDE